MLESKYKSIICYICLILKIRLKKIDKFKTKLIIEPLQNAQQHLPIDNILNLSEIISTNVIILQIIGMFSDINN